MKRQPTSQIIFSLVWALPFLLLAIYGGFRIGLWADQTFNLPKPFIEPANQIFGLVLWVIFLPIYLSAVYYLLRRGGGSPNPWQASPVNLVKTGPYHYIRHPMNLTYPFIILGVAVFLNSFSAVFFLTPLSALVFWYHALVVQEKGLTKQFGKEYKDYKRNTPAFIPKLKI
jgi:protein-S-isoprenylcysteine O-methyltransferase Ste14